MNKRTRLIFLGVIGLAIMIVAVGLIARSQSSTSVSSVSADISLRQTQVALQQTEIAVQMTKAALQQTAPQNNQNLPEKPAATLDKPAPVAAAPAATSLPTETPMPPSTSTPTPVPSPTSTPTLPPSPTATRTPVPPPQFSDNFDGGLKSDWQPILGQVGTVNGKMTLVDVSESRTGVIALGNPDWDNFAIEFDVNNLADGDDCKKDLSKCYSPSEGMNTYLNTVGFGNYSVNSSSRMAILTNINPYTADKLGKSEGFFVGESRLGWGTIDLSEDSRTDYHIKGQWDAVVGGGLVETTQMPQPRHFRIEKRGQNYLVFYDGQQISQYSTRLPAGKLGLWFGKLNDWDSSDPNAVPMVDSFEIKPLF